MQLSVSNIAWSTESEEDVLTVLSEAAVQYIDVAPGRLFKKPTQATYADAQAISGRYAQAGVKIHGMQSLLYGTDHKLFGNKKEQSIMLNALRNVCRSAEALGARKLVFGSPDNRDAGRMNFAQAKGPAVAFFKQLGPIAKQSKLDICIEPIPGQYGCTFMHNWREVLEVVEAVRHPYIKMQLDTGSLIVNQNDPAKMLGACKEHIGHIHISEPDLRTLEDIDFHTEMAEAMQTILTEEQKTSLVACIEMRAVHNPILHAECVRQSIEICEVYRQIS